MQYLIVFCVRPAAALLQKEELRVAKDLSNPLEKIFFYQMPISLLLEFKLVAFL